MNLSFSWNKVGAVEGSLINLYGNKAKLLLEGNILAISEKAGEKIHFSNRQLVKIDKK